MAELQEFLAMGGHGFYVWLAWGVSVFVIVSYSIYVTRLRGRVVEEVRWQALAMEEQGSGGLKEVDK